MAIFLSYMNESFETLTQSFEEIMEAMGSSQRFFDVLKRKPSVNFDGGRRLPGMGLTSWREDGQPRVVDNEGNSTLPRHVKAKKTSLHPIIEFQYVSFSYPTDPDYVILSNLNLSLLPGSKYAIVGNNGAGKSTVFKLMNRLYDPDDVGDTDACTMRLFTSF